MTFEDFISPQARRLDFIQNYLAVNGIETSVIPIKNKQHLLVRFNPKQYDPSFRMKTVIAHYDRVDNSEGANDNSFAVFNLMEWAKELSKLPYSHNIRLIFTDGEEQSDGGVKSQGAFLLAELLKKLEITDDIYVFDCMGRGEVPVLSNPNLPPKAKKSFLLKYRNLEKRASQILSSSSDKWLSLPTAYSDNAGFLAAGIPCVAITMLPALEATNYIKLLIETKAHSYSEVMSKNNKNLLKKYFPITWLLINSHRDTKETLTVESVKIFQKILNNLALQKTLT
ncbi:MAG: M28 family peptidase [Treponema sp.]|nr:M28 family peptidase [Treponema sp.]